MYDVVGFREEPDAGKPHVRICEGEAEWLSYSTTITRGRHHSASGIGGFGAVSRAPATRFRGVSRNS